MNSKNMWRKLKNPISILVGILIISLIMSFPITYFKQVDASRYNTRHYMERIKFELDTDVENVYMVNELHRILKSPYQMDVVADEGLSHTDDVTLTVIDDYEIESVIQFNDDGILVLGYDTATNKVVRATYKAKNYNRKKYIEKLCTVNGDKQMEEELRQFLNYLGLEVIDDWFYDSVWDAYGDYDIETIVGGECEWKMVSRSARLELCAMPEEDGVKYYFRIYNN